MPTDPPKPGAVCVCQCPSGDPFRKPLHGERAPMSVRGMHSILDAARGAQNFNFGIPGGRDLLAGQRRIMAGGICEEDVEFKPGDVVGLTEMPFGAGDEQEHAAQLQYQLLWKAELYDLKKHEYHKFGIVLGQGILPDCRYSEVATHGHVRVRLEVVDPSDKYAVPVDGEKYMMTSSFGFPIIGKEPEDDEENPATGMRWAEVQLHSFQLGRIYGRNETGSKLSKGQVAAIRTHDVRGGSVTWDEVLVRPTVVELEKVHLAGAKLYQNISWGVVTAPEIEEGELGEISIAGLEPVVLDVLDSTHQFCRLVSGGAHLVTCQYGGHARVLWRDSGAAAGIILFPTGQLPTFGIATSDVDSSGRIKLEVGGLELTNVHTPDSDFIDDYDPDEFELPSSSQPE